MRTTAPLCSSVRIYWRPRCWRGIQRPNVRSGAWGDGHELPPKRPGPSSAGHLQGTTCTVFGNKCFLQPWAQETATQKGAPRNQPRAPASVTASCTLSSAPCRHTSGVLQGCFVPHGGLELPWPKWYTEVWVPEQGDYCLATGSRGGGHQSQPRLLLLAQGLVLAQAPQLQPTESALAGMHLSPGERCPDSSTIL